jgi:hypothetical protein
MISYRQCFIDSVKQFKVFIIWSVDPIMELGTLVEYLVYFYVPKQLIDQHKDSFVLNILLSRFQYRSAKMLIKMRKFDGTL